MCCKSAAILITKSIEASKQVSKKQAGTRQRFEALNKGFQMEARKKVRFDVHKKDFKQESSIGGNDQM